MTAHSPAAIAAYPDQPTAVGMVSRAAERTAYDRGATEALAVKHEADREALTILIANLGIEPTPSKFRCPTCGHWCNWADGYGWVCSKRGGCGDEFVQIDLADAILASGILREAGKPVVDVEALTHHLGDFLGTSEVKAVHAALTAADGPLRDEREVKAEAWDEGYMAVPAEPEDREFFVEDADNPYRKGVL